MTPPWSSPKPSFSAYSTTDYQISNPEDSFIRRCPCPPLLLNPQLSLLLQGFWGNDRDRNSLILHDQLHRWWLGWILIAFHTTLLIWNWATLNQITHILLIRSGVGFFPSRKMPYGCDGRLILSTALLVSSSGIEISMFVILNCGIDV